MIRHATNNDAAAIRHIYNHYVLNTIVTFEEEPVLEEDMLQRMADVQLKYPWLVYEEDDRVVGYAYAAGWKARSGYRHTVESSVYLDPAYTGRGIGKLLYATLLNELKELKVHAVIGGAAMPNDVSVRLHESLGFKKIGLFIEVGMKFGNWVDVGYWELFL